MLGAPHDLSKIVNDGHIVDDDTRIILSSIEKTAYHAVLRDVVSEIEHCCVRAEARRELVDMFLDPSMYALLSLVLFVSKSSSSTKSRR